MMEGQSTVNLEGDRGTDVRIIRTPTKIVYFSMVAIQNPYIRILVNSEMIVTLVLFLQHIGDAKKSFSVKKDSPLACMTGKAVLNHQVTYSWLRFFNIP